MNLASKSIKVALKGLGPIAAILAFNACGNHSFHDDYHDEEIYSSSRVSQLSSSSEVVIQPSSSSSSGIVVVPQSSNSEVSLPSSSSNSEPKCGSEPYDPSTQYCSGAGVKEYYGFFTDSRDGKIYKITQIGTQTWMAENLNYDAGGSKCYGNKESNCNIYGRLYDWHTAMGVPSNFRGATYDVIPSGVRGICPTGWHLPSDAEWKALLGFIGANAGTKLKAGDWNGTDDYGFSALPGGDGLAEGASSDVGGNDVSISGFFGLGISGYWWTSYDTGYYLAYYRCIGCYGFNGNEMNKYFNQKTDLFSVRCLK